MCRYLLVKDVKKAIEGAKQKELESSETNDTKVEQSETVTDSVTKSKADLEYEEDLKKAIAMSLECEPSTSNTTNEMSVNKIEEPKKVYPAEFSFLDNFTDADFVSSSSSEDEEVATVKLSQVAKTKLASAQSYMLEYSGLTPNEINSQINKVIGNDKKISKVTKKAKSPTLPVVIESVETVTSTVNEDSSKDDSVEIMSTSDSSDSESEKIKAKSNVVVIDPNLELNEDDDLFADVFAVKSNSVDSSVQSLDQTSLITSSKLLIGRDSNTASSISAESKLSDDRDTEQIQDEFKNTNVEVQEKVNEILDTLPSSSSLLKSTPENKKVGIPKGPKLGEKELNALKEQLQKDKVDLITERATKERMAENITDQMYQEAQVNVFLLCNKLPFNN